MMNKKNGISPEDILPNKINNAEINGLNIRKGTVAAVLANIELLESPLSSIQTKESALQIIKSLVPALIALGLGKHVTWKNPQVQSLIDQSNHA